MKLTAVVQTNWLERLQKQEKKSPDTRLPSDFWVKERGEKKANGAKTHPVRKTEKSSQRSPRKSDIKSQLP